MAKLTLDQVNLVCRDTEASIAFYRRLGVDIPDAAVWRTATGAHHISAGGRSSDQAIDFDLDSTTFAQCWNSGWKGLTDLKGRVVVGFSVDTRGAVDEVFRDMTSRGISRLAGTGRCILGRALRNYRRPGRHSRGRDESDFAGQEVAAPERVNASKLIRRYPPGVSVAS